MSLFVLQKNKIDFLECRINSIFSYGVVQSDQQMLTSVTVTLRSDIPFPLCRLGLFKIHRLFSFYFQIHALDMKLDVYIT